MREMEIVRDRRPWAVGLIVVGLAGGCKPEAPAAGGAPPPTAADSRPEPATKAAAPAEDPQRAAKLADLDALCKALDHDYVDGTLSDYYREVEPTTEWGKAQRKAGDEAMQPGRLLEKAVAELDPGGTEPALGNCRKLLDYLDDVE